MLDPVNAQQDAPANTDAGKAARDAQALMRLGWMLAETLGRYRLGDVSRRLLPQVAVDRGGSVLPLSVERSAAEQRIEAEGVLIKVATDQHFDFSLQDLHFLEDGAGSGTTASAHMVSLATQLYEARKAGSQVTATARLSELNELFYRWDSKIQDILAAELYGGASSYQLGRGVAETYWALDETAAPQSYASWDHLLVLRFNTLATLLRRCANTLPKLAAETVTATLEQWRGVAESFGSAHVRRLRAGPIVKASRVDTDDAVDVLRQQSSVWRDLLLSKTEPATVLATDQTWARARKLWPLVKSFWLELVVLLSGLLLVGGAIAWVTFGGGLAKVLGGTLIGVLGAFGVTTSTFLARLKAIEQGLMRQLQDKITADAVIAAATYLPDSYARHKTSIRQAASAGSGRHLGPVVAYDHDRATPAASGRRRAPFKPAATARSTQ